MKHLSSVVCPLLICFFEFGFTQSRFPYIVKIDKFDRTEHGDVAWSYFSGVILDKLFIITSASLLEKSSNLTVRIGFSTYKVEDIIIHESYSLTNNTVQNDIALLKLLNPIDFSGDGVKEAGISAQLSFDEGLIVDTIEPTLSYKAVIVKCKFNFTVDDTIGCVAINKIFYALSDKNRGIINLNGKIIGHIITGISSSDKIIKPFVKYAVYQQWACEIADISANFCKPYSSKKDSKIIYNNLIKRLNDLEGQQQKFNVDVNAFKIKFQDNLKQAKEHYDDLILKGNERINILETKGKSLIDKSIAFSSQINEITTFGKNKIASIETFLYDLRSDVTKIASQYNTNRNKANDLETQVKSLWNQMNMVVLKLHQYDNDEFKSIESKINKLQLEINRLGQQIEANNSVFLQVTILQEKAGNITNTITTLSNQIDSSNKSVKSKFDELDAQKATISAKIEKIEKQLTNCSCLKEGVIENILESLNVVVEDN